MIVCKRPDPLDDNLQYQKQQQQGKGGGGKRGKEGKGGGGKRGEEGGEGKLLRAGWAGIEGSTRGPRGLKNVLLSKTKILQLLKDVAQSQQLNPPT